MIALDPDFIASVDTSLFDPEEKERQRKERDVRAHFFKILIIDIAQQPCKKSCKSFQEKRTPRTQRNG
jgi:hypothetical protein